ncbi:hypothetical protein [Schlesneria paludicola]|uniref:hypothetical protein n=1 Tax=Schlesneria paludicola TaxID=360056 RepID=UPI00029AF0D3|nr:hypothetical protein [Schlesneria paludicola]
MSGLSNHYDTIVAVKTIIDALNLSGLSGGTVVQEVAEYLDGLIPLPFVSISPYGPEKLGDEFNDRDGVYYGVLVAIIGKKEVTSLEQRLAWRQSMRRKLNNVSLFGLGQNYNLEVEPGNVIEPRAYFDRKAFVSGFVVRAFFQEPRT